MIKKVLEEYRKKAKLILVKHRLESLIKSTTDTDVKLKSLSESNEESEKEAWCYIPKEKTIYYPESGDVAIQKLEEEEIIAIILHEIGHAKYTELPIIEVKDIPTPKYGFAQLLNAMEDIRIERQMTDTYPGTFDSFVVEAKLADKLLPREKILSLPPHANFLVNIIRASFNLPTYFSEKAQDAHIKLKDELEKAYCSYDTNTMINNYLLPKVWDTYSELFDGEEQDDNKEGDSEKGNKEEKSDGNKSKGEGEKEDKKEGEKEDKKGEEKEEEETEKEKEEKKEINNACQSLSNIKDIMDKLKDQERQIQKGKKPAKNKDKKKNETGGKNVLRGFGSDEKEREDSLSNAPTNLTRYESYYADILPYLHFFQQKLGSIMIDNQLKRRGGSYRSGKLNNKMLYKFRCNNPKLFSKNIMRLHKEYSVMLLVDESGSMYGDRIINAIKTTVLLGEVLDKCHIPFSIMGFNENLKDYKDFKEPYSWKIKRGIEKMVLRPGGNYGGATTDVWGLAETRHRMKQRTGEKIIIVITDGMSAPSGKTIPKHLRKLLPKQYDNFREVAIRDEVKRATQENNIVIGIGIQTSYVREVYPQSAATYDVCELPKQVLNLLKRNIKRG